ncbi:hypothetical protein ES703_87522 [subsurface metagenome]
MLITHSSLFLFIIDYHYIRLKYPWQVTEGIVDIDKLLGNIIDSLRLVQKFNYLLHISDLIPVADIKRWICRQGQF